MYDYGQQKKSESRFWGGKFKLSTALHWMEFPSSENRLKWKVNFTDHQGEGSDKPFFGVEIFFKRNKPARCIQGGLWGISPAHSTIVPPLEMIVAQLFMLTVWELRCSWWPWHGNWRLMRCRAVDVSWQGRTSASVSQAEFLHHLRCFESSRHCAKRLQKNVAMRPTVFFLCVAKMRLIFSQKCQLSKVGTAKSIRVWKVD